MTIQVWFLHEYKKFLREIDLFFSTGFVGVQSVPRNDIPTISLQNSIESNTSSSNENISTSSSSYNSAKAYRSYVNSISTTHIVDNVKIYVKNIGISNKGEFLKKLTVLKKITWNRFFFISDFRSAGTFGLSVLYKYGSLYKNRASLKISPQCHSYRLETRL